VVVFGDDADDKCIADGREKKERHVARDERNVAWLAEYKHAAGEVPENFVQRHGEVGVDVLVDAW